MWLVIPAAVICQAISGLVQDAETGEPLPYVNIGIVHGDRGTVSDETGYYSLDLTDADSSAVLRYSFIGYESLDLKVRDVDSYYAGEAVQLTPKVLEMKAVVVFPREYAEKIVGNPNPLNFAYAGFGEDSLGYEAGIRVKIRKRPTLLEELRLHGISTTYDTVFYRLNVYDMVDGKPANNILNEPIYITLTDWTAEAYRTIDLRPYRIVVQDDFVITLEYVRSLGDGNFQLKTGFMSGKTFIRKTSQGSWYSMPLGYGMSVLIRYQK